MLTIDDFFSNFSIEENILSACIFEATLLGRIAMWKQIRERSALK